MASYQIKCNSCGTINRIPAEKEGLAGRCGNCRATLPPLYHQPVTLTERTFDDFVIGYQGPVIVEFWATW